MKLLFWIVGVPLLLIAALFAVANREAVTVSLWPLADPLEMPLFIAMVAPLYLGVVIGVIAGWWSGHRARSRARSEARRADALERETAGLKQRLQAMEGYPSATANARLTSGALQSPAALPPTFAP